MASALVALATASPVAAQGNSGNTQKTKPPNSNRLLTRGVGSGTTPTALIDDASLLDPGSASLGLSVTRWQGSSLSEVDAPTVYGAVGLHPRLQVAVGVAHVVANSNAGGSAGGLGTVFLSGKIGLVNDVDRGLKLAVAPTIEVLSADTLASMAAGSSRAQFGLPVGVEWDHRSGKIYAGVGYYSNGSWFAGIGAGLQPTPKVSVSLGFSRAWTNASATDPTLVAADRNEVSIGVSRTITSRVSAYASIAQTVATLDENGAGTTVAVGLSLSLPAGTLTR